MDRNLWLYPRYAAARNLLFWLPVFFLYFQQSLSLSEALWLEAVYYAAFVVLEVPSGYASDRMGRRATLVTGASLSAMGAALFAAGDSLEVWALGQLLFAAGYAFDSGTDSSLLYDTLAAMGRETEFRARESRASSASLWAVAISSLLGGLLGAVDLRLAYVATALCVGASALLAASFAEPPRRRAEGARAQGKKVLQALIQPVIAWTLCAAVAGTVLNHVPYEFLQPWLAGLVGDMGRTPVWSGSISFVIVGIGAMAAARADTLAGLLGATRAVTGALALQVVIIASMGTLVSPWLIPLLALRGVPGALARPILGSMQHPLLDSDIRATTLSVQSLLGRMSFGLSLLIAGWFATDGLPPLLFGYAALGAAMVAGLVASAPR